MIVPSLAMGIHMDAFLMTVLIAAIAWAIETAARLSGSGSAWWVHRFVATCKTEISRYRFFLLRGIHGIYRETRSQGIYLQAHGSLRWAGPPVRWNGGPPTQDLWIGSSQYRVSQQDASNIAFLLNRKVTLFNRIQRGDGGEDRMIWWVNYLEVGSCGRQQITPLDIPTLEPPTGRSG